MDEKKKKKISIVVPVFNEGQQLRVFLSDVKSSLHTLGSTYIYEVIFVDDGSTDESSSVIRSLNEEYPFVKSIIFSRNFGKEMALTAGIHHATGDACILIDADSQHPVDMLPFFVKEWEKGALHVVGVRKHQHHTSFFRRFGSYCFNKLLASISETPVIPYATDYRLLDRKVVNVFCRLRDRTRLTRGLIDWLGFETTTIHFMPNKRVSGETSHSPFTLFRLAFSSIVTLTLFPLKVAGYLGVCIMAISLGLGIFVFFDKFIFHDPWGFNFSSASLLVILILFVTGLILTCLGFITLYIASIYEQVIARPMYIVKETNNIDDQQERGKRV